MGAAAVGGAKLQINEADKMVWSMGDTRQAVEAEDA
jgi:hypothetical protein